MNTVDLMRKYSEILKESVNAHEQDEFTLAYMEALLWSETDDNGASLDSKYSISDFAGETLAQIIIDCTHFQREANLDQIQGVENVQESAGHDFWLTRAGHGAGFWDGDWPEPFDILLTNLSEKFGEQDIYVGDDGELYLQ